MNRALQRLSIATTVIIYIVLQMGALVTNTGSADGCGASWPLCKNSWMPNWDYAAIIEFSHRIVSGLAGLLTLILAIWIWNWLPKQRLLRGLSLVALVTVIFQGLLGAAAVIWPQPKAVLALHFGISLICFSAVLLVTLILLRGEKYSKDGPVPPALARWVWVLTLFVYGVIYLGAYVRHLHASLACFGWPLCNGELLPTLYGQVGISFAHRVGAALAVVMVIRLAFLAHRFGREHPFLVRAAYWALLLILLQVISGAVIALGHLNLLTQMLHSAILALFWGVLSLLCLEVATAGSGKDTAKPGVPK